MRFSYRKTRNVMPLILALVMLFQLVAPVFSNDAFAKGGKELDYRVIADVNLAYPEGIPSGEYTEPNSAVKIDYKWEILDNWAVEDGDYAIIPIPEAFDLGNANFDGDLISDNQNYGKWLVDVNTRQLKLTFNNMLDVKSNISGLVSMNLKLRLDEIKVELPHKLKIPISGGETKDFNIMSKPSDNFSINKSGKISEDDIVTDNIDEKSNYIDASLDEIDVSKAEIKHENNAEFNGKSDSETTVIEEDTLIKKEGKASQGFNADKIDWEIYVNQSSYKLNGVKVEDTIPEGLELDKEIKVHSLNNRGRKVIVLPHKYNIEQSGNTFTISFKDEIDKEYLIEYTTKVNADELKNNKDEIKFENDAKVTWEGKEDGINAKKEVALKKGKVINKDVEEHNNDDEYIDWVLDVNLVEQELNTDTINDIMGPGLKLDNPKQVEVYELNIDKDTGEISQGRKLRRIINYKIDYNNKSEFNISLRSIRRKITKPYRIKYRTIITNHDTSTFENTGIVDGVESKKTVKANTEGKFKIIKVDGNDNSKKLSDVKFELYRLTNGKEKHLGEISTDKNGEYTSPGLEYGDYVLREVKTSDGYQLSKEDTKIKVDKKYTDEIKEVTIKNYKKSSIEIIKTDKDDSDMKLDGAEFSVEDSDGKLIGNIVTDKNGFGELKGLDFGKYTVKEVKAPKGYKLDDTEHEVLISIDDKDKDGKVILTKGLKISNEKDPSINPEDPEDPKIEDPEPEKPGPEKPKPGKPKPEDSKKPDTDVQHPSKGGILPKTGEDSNLVYYITGLLLVVAGGVFFKRK